MIPWPIIFTGAAAARLVVAFRRLMEEGLPGDHHHRIHHGYCPCWNCSRKVYMLRLPMRFTIMPNYSANLPAASGFPNAPITTGWTLFSATWASIILLPPPRGPLCFPPPQVRCIQSYSTPGWGGGLWQGSVLKQVWAPGRAIRGLQLPGILPDIAYDLPLEYVGPHLHPPGMRTDSGIKYYRITREGLAYKEPYRPEAAIKKAAEHAGNFMFNREQQVKYLSGLMGRPPIVVAPYDAELFGHWWFEGPRWLDHLCRKIAHDQDNIKLITPGDYLDLGYPLQISNPNPPAG